MAPLYQPGSANACTHTLWSSLLTHQRIIAHAYSECLHYLCFSCYVQDIELGDSPVLCICVVGKKVWLGLEAGVLIIYDANTRKPYLQVS